MTVRVSKRELIAIPLAARMVYQRAYGRLPPQPHLAERLNGLAYCLAQAGGVYVIEKGAAAPRRLSADEIACGHFRNGGRELHFLDERTPIFHLGVTESCLEKAVRALVGQAASRS
jgi:hypothetical protein